MARDIENKEWLNDYAQLKQVSTTNPFTVPDGYFDELGEHITAAIKLDELKNKNSSEGFTVPDNYFENLSSDIQSRLTVEAVLNTEATGLTVPDGYFEELNSNIKSRIAIDELLHTEATSFTVPENYFEELSSNIQSRIAVEELLAKDDSSGLAVPPNYFNELSANIQSRLAVEEAMATTAEAFTVPEDYFSRLNKNILNKTVNQDIVKRKSAVIRMISSTAFKYATAACLIMMIGTGIFYERQSPEAVHDRSFLHKQLAEIPAADIQNYLEQNLDGTDTQHTIATESLPVSTDDLKNALQDYIDE